MAADEASLQRILAENPSLQREQFLVGSQACWSRELSLLCICLSDPEPAASKDVAALKLPSVRAEQEQHCQVYHGWDSSRTGWLGSHGEECRVGG